MSDSVTIEALPRMSDQITMKQSLHELTETYMIQAELAMSVKLIYYKK